MQYNPENLFDQLTSVERKVIATLLGFSEESPGFRNNLRDMPVIPPNTTYGKIAEMYCIHIIKRLG